MSELQRYGLQWNGPEEFVCTPMGDGYWTPWHVADQLLAARDATIAALTKERDLALLSAQQMKDAWDAACHAVGVLQAETERYKEAIHAMLGWLESDVDTGRAIEIGRHVLKPSSAPKAARELIEPPSGSLTEMLQSLPVIGVLNIDNPHDPRHKEWKDLPAPSGETSATPVKQSQAALANAASWEKAKAVAEARHRAGFTISMAGSVRAESSTAIDDVDSVGRCESGSPAAPSVAAASAQEQKL